MREPGSQVLGLMDPDGLEIEITLETPERCTRFGHKSDEPMLFDVVGQPHTGRERLDVAAELSRAEGFDLMALIVDKSFIAHLHFKVGQIEPALNWFEVLGLERQAVLKDFGFAVMGQGARSGTAER